MLGERIYNAMLCLIELPSRKAYAHPLKTKSAKEVESANHLFSIANPKIHTLTTDNRKEVLNDSVKKLLKKHEILHHTTFPGDHNRIILNKIEYFE